ncbi:probable cytochrome P450 6w1 [Drosophila albomicans]|uniref:Probable cytochrome P450 6w1 n=1 Tax=Drosophila albomicans TaxID=7291 RepID=A0A6P8WK29_DROAB|nr:probable cytochrome P450 6w1 [Drosophila albomicans]
MFTELFLILTSVFIALYFWQKRLHSFWERNGVKSIKSEPILGNFRTFLSGKVPLFEQLSLFYNTPGFENEPLIGVNLVKGPGVVIRDVELAKTVMIKKFNFFTNRSMRTDPIHDALGANTLFFSRNPEWKNARSKLTPIFTSGKMKQMYPLMLEVAKELEQTVEKVSSDSAVRIKDICARFTIDNIATIAFGIKANTLKDRNSEFYKFSTDFFNFSLMRVIDSFIIFMLPALASLARVKIFSKGTRDFFIRTITYAINEREKSGVHRNDLIDILVAMKQEDDAKSVKSKNWTPDLDHLVAHAAIFQLAGYETSSSTMTLTLYELALNPDCQERVRAEIKDYFGDQDHISYERLQEMPYLGQVLNETLRKYPVAGFVERECAQPESGEKFTLKPYYDVEVPSGTPFYVPTLAIHRDEKYWPNPDKYDPERFTPENRNNINMDAYMPFGIGPRSCLGMRLALLQTKLGLAHFLRNHSVNKCDKTVDSFKFQINSPVMSSAVDLLVQLQKD